MSASEDALGVFSPLAAEGSVQQDAARFRVLVDTPPGRPSSRLTLASVDPRTSRVRDRLRFVDLVRHRDGRLATPWLVLVSHPEDRSAPGFARRSLNVALGDVVQARLRLGGDRAQVFRMPVGRPSGERHPLAVRPIELRVSVLNAEAGGPPIVGGDMEGAREVMRHQISVLNDVLAPCGISAGPVAEVEVTVVDPPGPCLLSVGGRSGLPSAGGDVRLTVDGERYGPFRVGVGYAPVETARVLARKLEEAGFVADLSFNARASNAAFATTDIVVRHQDGSLADLGAWLDEPLTTDRVQSLSIGEVQLDDGLEPFGPNELATGTLEERTLVKALCAGDPRVIEIFVVSRFTGLRKQGESFVGSNRSALANVAIVDWRALGRARQAYTLAHEIGHILLDDLEHPDSRGDRRPFLLMHSRASSAVGGPMRITPEQCEVMRANAAALAKVSS
ncbi:MAG: hypothetical protein JRF63_09920 [Deltaproteobacteria bacterium]|nr:hypothetical protein [Deltaproteobacteria bacterium]